MVLYGLINLINYKYNLRGYKRIILMSNIIFGHHNPQSQVHEELQFVQSVQQVLYNIMQELNCEKAKIIQKWEEEKRYLIYDIEEKQSKIEKLQLRIHQLQKQNQQVRFQYEQRINLMNIIKRQNWILTKQFSEQKAHINLALDYLVAQNQKLQQQIIKYQDSVEKQMLMKTNKKLFSKRFIDPNPQLCLNTFYSLKNLHECKSMHRKQNDKTANMMDLEWTQLSIDKRFSQQQKKNSNNTSNSCIGSTNLPRRPSYFNQSRATEVKGNYKSNKTKFYQIQTKTMLFRQANC